MARTRSTPAAPNPEPGAATPTPPAPGPARKRVRTPAKPAAPPAEDPRIAVLTTQVHDANANTVAVAEVLESLGTATDMASAVGLTLDAVRKTFGWSYGCYWVHDGDHSVLRFSVDSGTAGEDLRRFNADATVAMGEGLTGQSWE